MPETPTPLIHGKNFTPPQAGAARASSAVVPLSGQGRKDTHTQDKNHIQTPFCDAKMVKDTQPAGREAAHFLLLEKYPSCSSLNER
ncbi:unknown protein [Desulfotalea psychrophila LSv54]|uniref:Uncharacterized protein n=1 Tax=Desulfotalea psychrophila (strain LSv54 / DSM 12343) TaxID=177439 RepID=Q6ARM3_DESPS|nr:unknown protein [Desulfotalea psychrophila LSv54]